MSNTRLVFCSAFQVFHPLFLPSYLFFENFELYVERFMKFDEAIDVIGYLV